MTSPFVPLPFQGDDDQIERFATKVHSSIKSMVKVKGVSEMLRMVVPLLGGKIEVARAPSAYEWDGGSLVIEKEGPFLIRLSPNTSPLRDNFTIAHELGHFFLHYPHQSPPEGQVIFSRYGNGPVEAQANRFAAALLMPAKDFCEAWKKWGDLYLVAGHFQVSPPAVQVRKSYIKC